MSAVTCATGKLIFDIRKYFSSGGVFEMRPKDWFMYRIVPEFEVFMADKTRA